MDTTKNVPAAPVRFMCVMIAALLAAAPPSGAEDWRPLVLSDESTARLTQEFRRALALRFEVDEESLVVTLREPRVRSDGDRFQLVAASGAVRLLDVDAWGLVVQGEVHFHDLVLDYTELVRGVIDLVEEPRVRPDVRVRREAVVDYMGEKGVLDPVFRVDRESGELVVGGAYRLRVLFFHLRPEVRVRGRLEVAGGRAGFAPSDVQVSRVPGLVRSVMQRHVHRLAGQGIFTDLALDGVRLAGGSLRILDAAGATLYAQDLPRGAAVAE